MANQKYRIFPNKVELFKFFGSYSEKINVSASSRLPLNGLAVDTKLESFRTFPEFFARLAELTGLAVDTKASTLRMGNYIVFFNEDMDTQKVESKPAASNTADTVSEILSTAAALSDDTDKQGSKAKLVEFAASKGVTLKGNKTFDKFMAEFEAALREDKTGE